MPAASTHSAARPPLDPRRAARLGVLLRHRGEGRDPLTRGPCVGTVDTGLRRCDPNRAFRQGADLMPAAPLAGIRVLEFSHTVMGPTAGLIFAELGADVIKIEPAPNGDHTRGLGGFGAGFFAAFNRNKRSLAVDLKRKEGQAVIHRLVPTADVILENFGPGTMERLGCGYEQLAALNPRPGYLALKGYLAGPYEHPPALDAGGQ